MGLGLSLNPMTGILKSRPREEMNRDTGKMPSDNGAQTGVSQLQPKERQRMPATTASQGERRGTESHSLQKVSTWPTL